jgi:hypothetical protein
VGVFYLWVAQLLGYATIIQDDVDFEEDYNMNESIMVCLHKTHDELKLVHTFKVKCSN